MKLLKKLGCFALGALLIWSLAYSNSFNRGDRAFKVFRLEKGKSYTHTVDLAKEGALKNLLQPGAFSLSYRLRLSDRVKLKLVVKTKDTDLIVSQGSKKGIWPALDFSQPLKDNGSRLMKNQEQVEKSGARDIPLSLELKVKDADKAQPGQVKLILLQDKEEYSTILLKIVNTKYKG